MTGTLFVVSAPSGTGKSTLASRLVAELPGLEFSVSFTTRAPREGEQDGREYHFTDRERFRTMAEAKDFLEWAPVFDECYGTGLEVTRRELARGRDLLLDIDVQGARQVRQGPIPAVLLMILPPDYQTLVRRLTGRATETEARVRRRLAEARREAEAFQVFDYVIVNDDLERSVKTLISIVCAERRRPQRVADEVRRILKTFPERTSPSEE